MTKFTSSPYEKQMTRIPNPVPEKQKTDLPRGHHCYGCGRFGEGCIRPCYRDAQQGGTEEAKSCSL